MSSVPFKYLRIPFDISKVQARILLQELLRAQDYCLDCCSAQLLLNEFAHLWEQLDWEQSTIPDLLVVPDFGQTLLLLVESVVLLLFFDLVVSLHLHHLPDQQDLPTLLLAIISPFMLSPKVTVPPSQVSQ